MNCSAGTVYSTSRICHYVSQAPTSCAFRVLTFLSSPGRIRGVGALHMYISSVMREAAGD